MTQEYDCMEKWNQILKGIMIGSVMLTLFRFLIDYVDLHYLRPEMYAIRSAPWYVGGLVYSAITLVVLLICAAGKAIIRYRMKKTD